ncbi:MAG: EamA/RhaT family transporter, partial [Eubacterium sp.]|nr:EamA/RhaT family transporter [Eubacterium sp.]
VSKLSVIGLMNPVFGVILSAVFLGEAAEAFSLKNLSALVLVCAGIVVVNSKISLQKRKS